jgi:uncharacterized membrane protein YgcG
MPTGILPPMHRWARALPSALVLLLGSTTGAAAAGPPFPPPEDARSVYDEAGVLRPEVAAELESRIDAIEEATHAEIVVYTQVDPGLTEEENAQKAFDLIDQWGVGRSGFDDGLALLVGLEADRVHGKVSLIGGSGFNAQHIDEDGLQAIVDDEFVPAARDGDLNRAVLDTLDAVQQEMAPDTVPLTTARVANAALGLIGAPMALLLVVGGAWWRWRREGDDPQLTDSASILMAGPPAEMTPALATVLRQGRASQHSINTLLAQLASTGRLAFHNLDRVPSMRSDDDPDPLTDPAIEVRDGAADDGGLPLAEREAWSTIRRLAAGSDRLSRERLWGLNTALSSTKDTLDREAVRIGWLTRLPGPAIGAMTAVGVVIMLIGAGVIWLGISIPMSGAVMFGAALVLGGVATIGFGRAMSKRTAQGAYVDAMLAAYRRTLAKTLEQARSMGDVVAQPEVAVLADTPDKAVVWGMALGLHEAVAALLARSLEDQTRRSGSPAGAYYPIWLGSTPGSAWASAGGDLRGGVVHGGGSVFSGSAMPDIGGMFDALGSVGSTPPSSSSSSGSGGGGFSGGGSSGGGGGSGSF